MEPELLLAKLQALAARMPNFTHYSPTSSEHTSWLAQLRAILNQGWMGNLGNPSALDIAITELGSRQRSHTGLGKILQMMHNAIAELELHVPADSGKYAFAAGETYDFFKQFGRLIKNSDVEIFIIDPYLDDTIFDLYLQARKPNVSVRLLTSNYIKQLIPALERYNQQHGSVVDVRSSKDIHDRVIFIDSQVCWSLGQSIKDAARAKPTSLVPVAPDIGIAKQRIYEDIWHLSTPIS